MIQQPLRVSLCLVVLATILLSLFYVSRNALLSLANRNSSVSALLGEVNSQQDFSFAVEHRDFKFPKDHSPHDDFRSEWWYFTGNLRGADEQEYGFDLTIFRFAIAPKAKTPELIDKASPFRSSQIYLAHFAIADVTGAKYLSAEKFSRALPGLTGASNPPLRLQVDNWSIEQSDPENEHWVLKASTTNFGMDLRLKAKRPVVLQGERGLSKKSTEPGNASYYYSIPKLHAEGEISIGQKAIPVTGDAWFDREWSTSALEQGQIGWDWFGLHIADDVELMYYQIRQANGKTAKESHGVLILENGQRRIDLGQNVKLVPLEYWTSSNTNARYPVKWRISIPSEELNIVVTAKFNDQQWAGSFVYWEGAVDTVGHYQQREILGQGFLEMTGYDRRQ